MTAPSIGDTHMTLANHPARASLIELDDVYESAAALVPTLAVQIAPQPPVIVPRPAGIPAAAVNVLDLAPATAAPAASLARGYVLPSTRDMQRVEGKAATFADMLKPADLDWDPEFAPLYDAGREVPAEVGRAVTRSDNRQTVGIVGGRYTIVPHREMAALGDTILAQSGGALRVANAGHRGGGSKVFMQLEAVDVSKGAGARSILTLATSHDGTSTARVGFSNVVVVCRNTFARAFRDCGTGLVIRHTASAADRLNDAKRIVEEAFKAGALFDAAALKMMGRAFGKPEMQALACHLIPGDGARAENSRRDLMRAWERAPGAQPGTVWGAAQAVTYHTSHTVGSAESRNDAAIFGTGKAADLQSEAWWVLDQSDDVTAERLQTVKMFRL